MKEGVLVMGMKQSIVIVNEFTVKTNSGGTRGGTPEDYVLRYMARSDAVEPISPVRKFSHDDQLARYEARSHALANSESVDDLKVSFRGLQGQGGVAFGYGSFSLSDDELKNAAEDIKVNFKNGKTVMKTVLSFDGDYLKKYGIVDKDFIMHKDGDYRGNIDQLKLRMAIMNGLDKLSRNFDDLQYIGVIQVDTKHVHCHLTMLDRGEGNMMPDGTQRGKLTDKDKAIIRRGIDLYLEDKQVVKSMCTNIEQDRQNTTCFVKKYTYNVMKDRGFSQFLLACLPDDRSLWRASTNRKEMQKPNSIVRTYVEDLLSRPDSGYAEAIDSVRRYAEDRMKSEKLSSQQYMKIYNKGRDRIIDQSMNAVYSVLKQIPEEEFTVDTRMMSVMAMTYEDMANSISEDDEMMEFGFRLRSYKNRLDHHTSEMHKYHEAVKAYDARKSDESARVLRDYFQTEEDYNAMLMCKYQYFLDFIPPRSDYQEDFDKLMAQFERLENLDRMKNDSTVKRMSAERAEEYCKKLYGESGGYYIVMKPEVFDRTVQSVRATYNQMRSDFKVKLLDSGMNLSNDNQIRREKPYSFDDVKAIDLHHLMYDFPDNINMSVINVNKYVAMADKRYDAFQKAKQYLESSGQSQLVSSFSEADINLQHSLADQMRSGDATFKSLREFTEKHEPKAKTIRLDSSYYKTQEEDIKFMIKSTVSSLQYE